MKLEELVGKPITEAQFDEAAGKKDACYHKVKARYDVWPSAYASGALVKCRKVGAANWGNKSKKKEGVNESMSSKVKRDMMIAMGDEAAMDDFLDKYGKYIPKSLNKSITRYRDDMKDAEMGYGNDKASKQHLLKIFKKHINEGNPLELNKLKDAIKMFQKKIKKQGRVTNARDEEHLERLMKVYNDMGGRKIKENSESLNWLQEKCWKGYEKKGMKTMFGKRYPNCVKKTK